ncbi:Broad specificity phosphatase PhoE [Cribrihabitans marinus]|uniref:Broad specificity phosphatase PhoE n=1 Tax=Cribrihabitans marinus TaxID=1227549 RepID=A0A1H7CS78_9RHOB|nr:histidine phosphatase family protein [Cribrihabitans marinus]GGH35679.1 phosphoglycerate mutase [Cribrihabitans marinus]SEJ89590.1 Broad specificity phosphatase PhoE [Cribrihabitans marinus]
MTRLHLVRHGPTHARTMVGWSDLPADLSDTEAIGRLSAHLPEQAVVVSSDLIRAADTATALQGARTRLPDRAALREMRFGDWELRAHADIEAEDPERIRAFWDRPGEVRPPGGESWHELSARVDRDIDALVTAHPGGDIVVVAHFGVILCQLQRALRVSAEDVFAHRIDNLSVTRITCAPEDWTADLINHRP